MLTDYQIEKKVDGKWQPAWGLKRRSWPRATSDAVAIEMFREETKKCSSYHRLIRFGGMGYGVLRNVLAYKRATKSQSGRA